MLSLHPLPYRPHSLAYFPLSSSLTLREITRQSRQSLCHKACGHVQFLSYSITWEHSTWLVTPSLPPRFPGFLGPPTWSSPYISGSFSPGVSSGYPSSALLLNAGVPWVPNLVLFLLHSFGVMLSMQVVFVILSMISDPRCVPFVPVSLLVSRLPALATPPSQLPTRHQHTREGCQPQRGRHVANCAQLLPALSDTSGIPPRRNE